MAGAIQLTEVDFQQIKTNLVEYLKSTKKFTDYDFEGSNLSVILNLIAYQAQLNSYSANMISNESFLASSSIRDNTVLNARMLGYLPTSQRSAVISVDLQFVLNPLDYPGGTLPSYIELRPGMCFSTNSGKQNFVFNIIDTQIAAVTGQGVCQFRDLLVYEGFYTNLNFTVDTTDFNQRFIIENSLIDTSTIRVEVQEDPNVDVISYYTPATNLVELDSLSRVFWIEEIKNGHYQLTFGDGLFGKKLENGAKISVTYLVSNGDLANGIQNNNNFAYVGQSYDSFGTRIRTLPTILNSPVSSGGAPIEDVPSIKFRAPKYFGAQQRCVTAGDYAALTRQIYPAVQDIYVYGGETLPIPVYGRVYVIIKPISGESLSNTTKNFILKSLADYRIASLDIVIEDPTILHVECVSLIRFDDTKTNKDASSITAAVKSTLLNYANSPSVAKFGGVVRYSRVVGAIDDSDSAITRNNTSLRMRRDIKTLINTSASYKICFNNEFANDSVGNIVWSTGFKVESNGILDDRTYYFEDDGQGNIRLFYNDAQNTKVITDVGFGTVDYKTGVVKIGYQNPITIVSTVIPNGIIEIRARPKQQDVRAMHSIYLSVDISKSDIQSVIDTEISRS
ncbi:baseplate wedge subunit [Synechococcus phage S-CRM01]|uniref:baseplate wedge subunit n=1 Tax=Synechococcus phage S-CRM01 TaxID=1026955 RepID=UPI000209E32E|nr:baseplate wedge subunit [Synechococcus phage S-CRM01]AEC53244.1 baseplate wedge subunit [Synechococcus phage S-CRM01]